MAPSGSDPSVLVLSGPNLGLLGRREPGIYGNETLDDVVRRVQESLEGDWNVAALQSNHEGELVEAIHAAVGVHSAIIINPGALTHYSWALHDALRIFDGPIVEVHLTNPQARESFRHGSVIAGAVSGSISGFGVDGYGLAARAVRELVRGAHPEGRARGRK